MKDCKEAQKKYNSFSLKIVTGSKRKKRMSNFFSVEVPDDRSMINVNFTIREARAISDFLNENLNDENGKD